MTHARAAVLARPFTVPPLSGEALEKIEFLRRSSLYMLIGLSAFYAIMMLSASGGSCAG